MSSARGSDGRNAAYDFGPALVNAFDQPTIRTVDIRWGDHSRVWQEHVTVDVRLEVVSSCVVACSLRVRELISWEGDVPPQRMNHRVD